MKPKYVIPVLFVLFIGCKKTLIDELPDNISTVKTVVNLVDSLKFIFPENGNTLLKNPALFSDTIQKNIILMNESNVYVSFLDESTDAKNTLCWYSYNKSQPPLKTSDIQGHVIFPNISKKGKGGLLELGYTVQLGTEKFPAGTVIGFFLISSGWTDGTINYARPTYYTNYNFNRGGEQFHILFKNSYSHYVVLGFEDNFIGQHDFNDILFAVSDNSEGNEASSFDLSKVLVK